MLQSYPVNFTTDDNGSLIAEFPDIPEAMTIGSDENNAIVWAQDALIVALTGYIEDRRL
jgi:antitoxin HicB